MIKCFFDTNALLDLQSKIFDFHFVISSKTLEEIEGIKTSDRKSEETKYQARRLAHLLEENEDKYEVSIITDENYTLLESKHLPISPDNLILSSAYLFGQKNDIVFVTNDINCKVIGNKIFGLTVIKTDEDNTCEEYIGYKTVVMTDEEMERFYSNQQQNTYGCLVNEYLLIKNKDGEIKDRRKWDGHQYIPIRFKSFKSKLLGDVKPMDGIQMCAFDSITNNEMTMLYGKAGSGKTMLALSYAMQGIESQKIKKCYLVHHFETLKKAKTLGFEKGSHDEKLLNTGSIGNILSSKFSDYKYITSLLGDKLEIVPTANIRGVEFGAEDMVFVTECQNIDSYTLKTIIQRCKAGCKQVYEGDMLEQSDVSMSISGMRRMVDVFKGYEGFGCIKLQNNYRNPICELADKM